MEASFVFLVCWKAQLARAHALLDCAPAYSIVPDAVSFSSLLLHRSLDTAPEVTGTTRECHSN
eukprot:3150461-Amphidinium_carterae.2